MTGLFTRVADGVYRPEPSAASPWEEGLLHGGPPAGLLAQHLQAALGADAEVRLVRVTVDLLRPVPAAPLVASAEVVRDGYRLILLEATLEREGTMVARASGLALRPEPGMSTGGAPPPARGPDGLPLVDLGAAGAPSGFHTSVKVRAVPGERLAWFRMPMPVITGEEAAPITRAVALADFANALAHLRGPNRRGFINTDITVGLVREPMGEWVCLETLDAWGQDGIAAATTALHDEAGRLGTIHQALLLHRPVPSTTFAPEFGTDRFSV